MSKKEQEIANPRTIGGVKFDINQNDIISVLASDIMEEFETRLKALRNRQSELYNYTNKAKHAWAEDKALAFLELAGVSKTGKKNIRISNVESNSVGKSITIQNPSEDKGKVSNYNSSIYLGQRISSCTLEYEKDGKTFRLISGCFTTLFDFTDELLPLIEAHNAEVKEFMAEYGNRTMRESVILRDMKNKFTRDFIAKSTDKELKNLLTTTFKVK